MANAIALVLPVGIEPADFGGNFTEGQRLHFSVRPDREAFLLMVNVNALGEATLLHPTMESERKPAPGGQLAQVPAASNGLRVQLPESKDIQFVFGFEQKPGQEWMQLDALDRLVQQRAGQFSFGHSEFRTWRRSGQ